MRRTGRDRRRRPRRARDEPSPHRGRRRPRRARTRSRWRTRGARAVGLAPPAHTELDDGAPGLPLRRRRSRRLHDRAATWSSSSTATAGTSMPPVRTGVDGRVGAPHRRRLRRAHRSRALAVRCRRGRDGRVERSTRPGARRRPAAAASTSSRRWSTGDPAQLAGDGRVLVVGASASGVQIADELRRGRTRRHDRRRRARPAAALLPGPRHLLVARPDRATRRALRRGGRHRARPPARLGAARRERRPARPRPQRAPATAACRSSVASWRSVAPRRQCSGSLANLAKNADLKQARLLRRIDEFVNEHGLADEVGPATEAPPTRLGNPPTELDLRRVLDRDLGDRVPTDVLVVDRGRVRPPGPGGPRRWCRGAPGSLPARSAVPAAPALEPHRRPRGGRRGSLRAPARLPGSAGAESRRALAVP